ncbi:MULTISPECIES: helix-turn-helix domain-containing protein [Streptomyces]|uniref:XRE family transcriptional regulator n=1 Tax=Streptomyces nodosus TaxID=40318 RepID=A0A0B5DQJ2_9ACTN|nr:MULTISPECIES: XRE family transcriptional regulator [Streptomyces]AJE43560.1 XRE family transcriptional regulator [Streptomyces nodosus]MBB4795038.1 transcriptional regulator with XRE-family HTH domain [Streptomyces nodosus]MYV45003.1 helix-turn-helix domain-containing protein [Streptomyces sp. SID2888]QEV42063.1 XRE family transcriptional regulator [Streptomyces nodosus]
MSSPENEPGPVGDLPAVAPQLRALRRRAALTLEAAARSAGLSPAHLSRLETGQRQPSLPMLLALARVYGTTVAELLGETVPDRDAVVRAPDMEPTRAGGWTYWQAGAPGRGMQALRVQVPYGTQGDIVRVHPGEEWLYVLNGRLRLRLGDATHLLAPGDSAHYDSLTPHRLAAVDHGGTELLFVHTLLQSPNPTLCLGPTPGETP